MANWQQENNRDKANKLILFIISPFLSFLYSLQRINTKSSYVVFFLFAVFYGMEFTVPDNRFGDYKGDGVAYRLAFEDAVFYDTYEFVEMYQDYLEFDNGAKDIYVAAVSFLVSRFTDNYHWVFTVYAFVFAFFMLKSLRFLTREEKFTKTTYNFMLLFIFIMSNFLFNINGVRFWTASWIGVYCIFQIFLNKNNRYFILAAITPLVHVSFFIFLFVISIAFLFKKYNHFWFVMFIISFFISSLSVVLMKSLESYFPPFIANTIGLYVSTDSLAMRASDTLLIVKIFKFLSQMANNITIILLYKQKDKFQSNAKVYNLFQFLMVWMTFVNFGMGIPSLGGRFMQLAIPIVAYLWLMVLNKERYSKWQILYLFSFSLSYYFVFKYTFSVTSFLFYISNPFYIIYTNLL